MNKEITEEEQIEEILTEANAYNLRQEVITTAEVFMKDDPDLNKTLAYEMAYMEWIKQMYENCIRIFADRYSVYDRNYRYKYTSTNTLVMGRLYLH